MSPEAHGFQGGLLAPAWESSVPWSRTAPSALKYFQPNPAPSFSTVEKLVVPGRQQTSTFGDLLPCWETKAASGPESSRTDLH